MKRIFILFMCLLFISAFICSCKIEADPFVTTAETKETTGAYETAPVTESTDDEFEDTSFYALNRKDSYEKYGMLSFNWESNYDNKYDGIYMYSNHYFADTDGGTLAKYKYPDVYNKTFVCPDPLCNHKNSGCPFFNAGSAIAYYEGKIYFNTESGNIYVYDISEGKRSKLADNSIMPRFIKYDGKLYLQYLKEYNDFNINMVYFIILPSGEMTELGQLSDINTNFGIIYNNKYYIDYQTEIKDDKGILSVLMRDIKTGKTSTAAEIETSRKTKEFDDIPANSCMLYGDKLLLKVKFLKYTDGQMRERQTDFWLVDLVTGDKRLICTPDYDVYGHKYINCLFSQKCIIWQEPRKKESNPLILHVLFPYTGEEKTYDLSKTVYDATGDTIPFDVWINDMLNSAIRLRILGKNERLYDLYLIDLENGNVRKNDIE